MTMRTRTGTPKPDRQFYLHIQRFADIKTHEGLAKFSVLQGPKWSTIPAFEQYGITVIEGDSANMADMLGRGRADLMPYPAIGSQKAFQASIDEFGLVPLPNVMLIWPGEHFFMVDRNNQALHDALYDGLQRAFDDGSYAELLRTHPDSKDAFHGIDLNAINLIHLENPYMTPKAQAALEKYDLSVEEIFGAEAGGQEQ